jgi:anion-transporting  ArsA/GET3 family ATPase
VTSLLARKLLVVTGKGGAGKTTVTAALGVLAARQGLRVVLVEMSGQRQLPGLLGGEGRTAGGAPAGSGGHMGSRRRVESPGGARARDGAGELELAKGLWCTSIDPDQALLDWLGAVGGKVPARMLASRSSFRYFAAAAPGAKELLSLLRIWELTQAERRKGHGGGYDLAILDAPATGHALAMLRSPATFGAIARVGPIAAQAANVRELLTDPALSGYVAVALASEAAITETLELADALSADLGRELDRVIVNGTFSRRFTNEELALIRGLEGDPALRAAVGAAEFVDERARRQQSQIRRVRRAELPVLRLPFIFHARMERSAIEQIANRLERSMLTPVLARA